MKGRTAQPCIFGDQGHERSRTVLQGKQMGQSCSRPASINLVNVFGVPAGMAGTLLAEEVNPEK